MSSSSKQQLVQKLVPLLKKKYESPPKREPVSVLEHLVLGILSDGTTTAKSDTVFERLKKNYFDWNEVRVSSIVELQEALAELPDAEQRAVRLKSCLKHLFETLYTFDLDSFRKLPMKEVAKKLEKLPVAAEYLTARVIRDGLEGTAMPLDSAAIRVLTRLELIDAKTPAEVLSASLSRAIPRARSFEFCHLLSELGADTCIEPQPKCKHCCLLEFCATGQRKITEPEPEPAPSRPKRTRTKARAARGKAE